MTLWTATQFHCFFEGPGWRGLCCFGRSRRTKQKSIAFCEILMKRLFVSVTGLALLGILNVHAAAQTNLVQSLHFNLTVELQGAPVTNQNLVSYSMTPRKIFTPDIIQVIGTSMSRAFSARATLLAVTPLSGAPGTVVIQDGTNRVDV